MSDHQAQMMSHHKVKQSKTFLCPTCDQVFPTSAARSNHRRQVHQRHLRCSTCDKAFSTSQKLERHIRTIHKSDKKYQCEECSKVFISEENLESHYQVHFEKKVFKCPHCSCEYFTISGLNKHLHQIHSTTVNSVEPEKCEFIPRTSSELELEIQQAESDHGGTTLITSNYKSGRNQQFRDSGHTGDTLYELLHPNENISQRPVNAGNSKAESQLDISMKAKNLKKKFTCQHCEHKFAFKNSLTKHLSKGRCIILKKTVQQHCIQVS